MMLKLWTFSLIAFFLYFFSTHGLLYLRERETKRYNEIRRNAERTIFCFSLYTTRRYQTNFWKSSITPKTVSIAEAWKFFQKTPGHQSGFLSFSYVWRPKMLWFILYWCLPLFNFYRSFYKTFKANWKIFQTKLWIWKNALFGLENSRFNLEKVTKTHKGEVI